MGRQALGKGLDALIPGAGTRKKQGGVSEISIEKINPNKDQPREKITSEKLEELINSIKKDGILQPIVVRPIGNDKYEIIAGERRFVAAQRIGLKTVPVIIKNVSKVEQLRLALIENIQREDLNPIEEAKAYKSLMDLYHCTQEELAEKLGKNRATIANTLRLLKLPKEIQTYIMQNELNLGQAKVIAGINDRGLQKTIADRAVHEKLSVRDMERILKKSLIKSNKVSRTRRLSPELRDIENKLQQIFGTKVVIKGDFNKGRIEIEYYNKEDLQRIIEILTE